MKVLILTNHQLGLYKFRKELLEKLVADKHKVYVSVPEDKFTQELTDIGVKIINNRFLDRRGTNTIYDLRLINYWKKILKKIEPDVVLTYTIKPNVYGGYLCGKLGIPYIANVTGLGTSVKKKGLMQKFILTLCRIGLRKARKVFFQNDEDRDFMLNKGIVYSPYDVLPGSGVNLEQYKLIPYPEHDTVDFVFIARIMKEKGIDQYCEAARVIRKRYPNTRFHICGFCEEAYEDEIKKLQDEGIISYHGFVKDMFEIYKDVDCVVHPTYYPEGLSNVLLEASASGRPIITTDRSGCREVVNDGKNGFLVKEKDTMNLICTLEKFISISKDEKKEMGLQGRVLVEKKYDRNIVVNNYIEEICRIKK